MIESSEIIKAAKIFSRNHKCLLVEGKIFELVSYDIPSTATDGELYMHRDDYFKWFNIIKCDNNKCNYDIFDEYGITCLTLNYASPVITENITKRDTFYIKVLFNFSVKSFGKHRLVKQIKRVKQINSIISDK